MDYGAAAPFGIDSRHSVIHFTIHLYVSSRSADSVTPTFGLHSRQGVFCITNGIDVFRASNDE
jgi:hypothetical protein